MATLGGYEPLEWVRTGIPALDLIMGAGIPRGRFIEVIGDPSTSKTGFACHAAAAFQRCGGTAVYFDAEAKLEKSWAEKIGVDFGSLGYDRPKDLVQAVKMIGQVAKTASPKVPTLLIIDSIAAIPGADELDDATSDKGIGSEKAARARLLSAALRATLMELARRGVTLLGLNQLRTTMNFYTAYSGLDSPGGKAIKYHASIRMMFRPKGRIRDLKRDLVTGIAVEVEAIKNTCAMPFRKSTLRFKFDGGFVPYSGLDELLLRHGRVQSSQGWLKYKDKSFRATEIESIAAEYPELLAPLAGVEEGPGLETDVEPFAEAKTEGEV